MESNAVEAVTLAGSTGALDFSIWALFLRADWIVKVVMVMLLFASVWCWAIIFEKWFVMRKLNAKADEFEHEFWSGNSLETLYDRVGKAPADPMAAVFVAAMREWRRAASKGQSTASASLSDRIDRVMQITLAREMDRVERYLTFLSSTGSTAPFVGLFGTVWGIMHSFQSIAASKNTSLVVVAPGIAEALFATAIGLFAAIPAVIFYNKFSGELDKYSGRLEDFGTEFNTLLSRQIDGGN